MKQKINAIDKLKYLIGKETNDNISKSKYLPLILTSIYFLWFYICIKKMTYDDVNYFIPMTHSDINLFDYLKLRYNEWTSRLLIEGATILVLRAPLIVWKLLTGLSMSVIIWSIYFIFFNKEKSHIIWIFCSFMILCNFPFLSSSAGWVITSLDYIWTAAALYIAIIPIKLIEKENKSNKLYYLFFLPCAIFASNQEIYAIFMLTVAFVYWICSIKRKKHEYYYCLLLIISIVSLIFASTCPGNASRFVSEIHRWYPLYGELSLVQKVLQGIVVLFYYIVIMNPPIFAFSAIFYVLIIFLNTGEKIIYRLISLIPLFGSIFGICFGFIPKSINKYLFPDEEFYGLIRLNRQLFTEGLFGGDQYHSILQFFQIVVIMIILFSYLFCFYIVLKNIVKNALIYLIIISGFLSQLAMSFSPTVYASGIRTATLLFISLAIAGTAIFSRYSEQKHPGQKGVPILVVSMVSVAVLSIIMFQMILSLE